MFLLFALLINLAKASPVIVYGEDNRHELFAEKNLSIKNAALSTAALISNDDMRTKDNLISINGKPYGKKYFMCEGERFLHQPAVALCSGTLITPDIIMTAAHCYDSENDTCKSYSWVFDYRVSKNNQEQVLLPSSSVYKCSTIMKLDKETDYALIKLEREVTDRAFITIQRNALKRGDPIVLVGHPRGLPTKIADGANILEVRTDDFITNVDAFEGNSGSGVFNPATGEVVAILVSGGDDFQTKNGCTITNYKKQSEGMETVIKLNEVLEYLNSPMSSWPHPISFF